MSSLRLACLLLVGCVPPRGDVSLRFVPQERITADNVGRVELAYCGRFGDYSFGEMYLAEAGQAITDAVVDGASHRLTVHRRFATGSRRGDSVGLETYDLRTGRLIRKTRLPDDIDMTGAATSSLGASYVDTAAGTAFVESVFPRADWAHRVVMLGLHRDAPRLPVPDADHRLARNPEVGPDRVLLVIGSRPPEAVAYADRKTGAVTGRRALPPGLDQYLAITGGVGDLVLGRPLIEQSSPERKPVALHVFEPAGDKFADRALTLAKGWLPAADAVDWAGQRWAMTVGPESNFRLGKRLRIYDIPTLRVIQDVPADPGTWQLEFLPGASLLVANASPDLIVYDANSLRELARISLGGCRTDDLGPYQILRDPEGRYLGVVGSHWVQLFAVRPADASGK